MKSLCSACNEDCVVDMLSLAKGSMQPARLQQTGTQVENIYRYLTIFPPRDLSDTHFPPPLPPCPHRATQLDRVLPNTSQTRPAAANTTATHPKGPAVA